MMKMKKKIAIYFIFSFIILSSYGQSHISKKSIVAHSAAAIAGSDFQNHLKSTIESVSPATVFITTFEKLTATGGVSGSGVCVSADGIIMTAGHLTVPGGKYQIDFPDGTKVPAIGLGKIGPLDAGLLKITAKGTFPFAKMGYTSAEKVGNACFSIAYPGSFKSRSLIRLGKIVKISDHPKGNIRFRNIQTTCLMEPGDSGGPVFNMDGAVIGIRSYIGMPLDENYDVPIDTYRKYWQILMDGKNFQEIPDYVSAPTNENIGNSYALSNELAKFTAQSASFSRFVVQIKSAISGNSNTILGTIVAVPWLYNKKLQQTFILSKNSAVGNMPTVLYNGKSIPAHILFRNEKSDLILLKINERIGSEIKIQANSSEDTLNDRLGQLLLSPMFNKQTKFSIYGAMPFEVPAVLNVGYLGLRLEQVNGKNVVNHVQPNTAAEKAGLNIGDELLSINQKMIDVPDTFIQELKSKKANDTITIYRNKNEVHDTLFIPLGKRPIQTSNHIAEQFEDGKSERRDGFEKVFIHDATLKPSECGGPVFDLKGNFTGINIARYSRVSSLVIPKEIVAAFIDQVRISQN